MIERKQRVYVKKGPHAGKYGKVLGVARKTAIVMIDKNFNGGTYHISVDSLEKE